MGALLTFPEHGPRFIVYIFCSQDPDEEELYEWGRYTTPERADKVAEMLEAYTIPALIIDDHPRPPPPPDPNPRGFTFTMPPLPKVRGRL